MQLGLSGRNSGQIELFLEFIHLESTAGNPKAPQFKAFEDSRAFMISRILSPSVQLGTLLFSEVVPERASQSWSQKSRSSEGILGRISQKKRVQRKTKTYSQHFRGIVPGFLGILLICFSPPPKRNDTTTKHKPIFATYLIWEVLKGVGVDGGWRESPLFLRFFALFFAFCFARISPFLRLSSLFCALP